MHNRFAGLVLTMTEFMIRERCHDIAITRRSGPVAAVGNSYQLLLQCAQLSDFGAHL